MLTNSDTIADDDPTLSAHRSGGKRHLAAALTDGQRLPRAGDVHQPPTQQQHLQQQQQSNNANDQTGVWSRTSNTAYDATTKVPDPVDGGNLRYGQSLIFSGKADPQRNPGQQQLQQQQIQRGSGGRATGGQQQHQNGNASVTMMFNSNNNSGGRRNNAPSSNSNRNSQQQHQRQRGGGGGSGDNHHANNNTQHYSNDSNLTSHPTHNHPNANTNSRSAQSRLDQQAALARLEQAASTMQLPEDMRISKLVRRLAVEKSPAVAVELCTKLQYSIADPHNHRFIWRSFEQLASTLDSYQLRDAATVSVVLRPLAHTIGQMGHVLLGIGHFKAYRKWLEKCCGAAAEQQRLLGWHSLHKVLLLDAAAGTAELQREHAAPLMELLKETLESADRVPLFTVVTHMLTVFSAAYPAVFERHFTDVVDIVVGWHLETEQTAQLKRHCSAVLQSFGRFWKTDAEFIANLLGQFLEDINQCAEEIMASHQQQQLNDHERTDSSGPQQQRRRMSSPLLDGSATPELCFAALVGAFTTVLKCAPDTMRERNGWQWLLSHSFARITAVATVAIERCAHTAVELLTNVNEFVVLMLQHHPLEAGDPFALVQQQLALVVALAEEQQLGVLLLTLIAVTRAKADHCAAFMERICGAESPLRQLRYSRSRRMRKAVLQIYTQVLNVKSVSVLQSVYRGVLSELGGALRLLGLQPSSEHPWPVPVLDVATSSVDQQQQAELTVCFLLTALSTLATSTSSIIAMWALQPSILELIVLHLQPDRVSFWSGHACLHAAVLRLLAAHCQKNSNFTASSGVLNAKSARITESFGKLSFATTSTTSPTTQHYQLVLRVIGGCLQPATESTGAISDHLIVELLDWCCDLFGQSKPYARTLIQVPAFGDLVHNMVAYATRTSSVLVVARIGRCLEALLTFEQLHADVYRMLAEVCCVHMCSTCASTRSLYTQLFAALPLRWSLRQVCGRASGVARERAELAGRMQRWLQVSGVATTATSSNSNGGSHAKVMDVSKATDAVTTTARSANAVMRPVHFRRLMETLALNMERPTDHRRMVGRSAFEMCWQLTDSSTNADPDAAAFAAAALSDTRCLHAWTQWAAAQHCVDTKLRSAIGKPLDTLLRIETMLKDVARILATTNIAIPQTITSITTPLPVSSSAALRNLRTVCVNQQNIRVLLGFLEALEKSIYNAGNGTAFAQPLADRPMRMFFNVNAPTCREWFGRCRSAVSLVALHSMEPAQVIRCAEPVLRQLAADRRTADALFEHTLVALVWALLRCGEADALHGLFVWTRTVSGRKLLWVQLAGQQAAGRREAAYAGYMALLHSPDGAQLDATIREFVVDQVTWCLDVQQQWQDLMVFQSRELGASAQRSTMPLTCKSNEQLLATATFLDATHTTAITHDLGNWHLLDGGTAAGTVANGIAAARPPMGGDLLSTHRLRSLVENTLIECIVDGAMPAAVATEKLRRCRTVCTATLAECLRTDAQEHLAEFTVLGHVCHKVLGMLGSSWANATGALSEEVLPKTTTAISIESLHIDRQDAPSGAALMRVLGWSELLQRRQQINGSSTAMSDGSGASLQRMHLAAGSLARKSGNLRLCERQLQLYFNAVSGTTSDTAAAGGVSLHRLCDQFVRFIQPDGQQGVNAGRWTADTVHGLYETAKWLNATTDRRAQAIQFGATAVIGIGMRVSLINAVEDIGCSETAAKVAVLRERSARQLLRLADWIVNEPHALCAYSCASPVAPHPLCRLVTSLPNVRSSGVDPRTGIAEAPYQAGMLHIDGAVGKLIQHAIQQSPDLAKTWGALGNWCYRWGRKAVEQRAQNRETVLNVADENELNAVLPLEATDDERATIVSILNGHQMSGDDEEMHSATAVSASSTELIDLELRQSVPVLAAANADTLQAVLAVWRHAQRNVYSYYGMAADAYFRFLHLTSTPTAAGAAGAESSANVNTSDECSRITATLRLLRLIVKHSLGLQEVLEAGLAVTPTTPWMAIIPQLFARLNHHEPYVRQRVAELLSRVAVASPHLIIFPTVVGCSGREQSELLLRPGSATDANSSPTTMPKPGDANSVDDDASGMTSCFGALLAILSQQSPDTVQQVQCLVRELKRVTLLWDELWLVGLAPVLADTAKRLVKFEEDLLQASSATTAAHMSPPTGADTVLAARHRLLFKSLLFTFERLHRITVEAGAETANENAFQRAYDHQINGCLAALRAPFSRERPLDAWQRCKQFYAQLQRRAHGRAAHPLQMADISPVLAQMRDTAIQMPGVESATGASAAAICCIKSVNNVVRILPTKTKPKKLAFHGSDGRRYTYLFKGMEDLHLDERIMQFLSIANTMMAKGAAATNGTDGARTPFRARHYSVIPLGSRSGLISWVDGVVPVYALYKKWQLREASHPKRDKEKLAAAAGGAVAPDAPPMRPNELYAAKLTPRLAAMNCKMSDARQEWPLEATRQTLLDLMAETPRDLLAKELWCHAPTAAAWRRSVRQYGHSVAVMSVIGYVIGLGDRHLDNILIELGSGEVVHIDYNVCFEKGKTLRVPEGVPFRMTPNVEEALGVTGVEGTFRIACAHVLRTLKRGRETLLTLLEAFVYDPLVDWAIGEGEGAAGTAVGINAAGALAVSAFGGERLGSELREAHKQLQHEVSRDTKALRLAEMRSDWLNNGVDIRTNIGRMMDLINQIEEQRNEIGESEARRDLLSKQLALVGDVQQLGPAMQSHPLSTASQRYAQLKRTRTEQERCYGLLNAALYHYKTDLHSYSEHMQSMADGNWLLQRRRFLSEATAANAVAGDFEFECLRELFESSDQHSFYAESVRLRRKLDAALRQQNAVGQQCIDLIVQYDSVVRLHHSANNALTSGHRLQRYADGCTRLSESPTVAECRDIVAQFRQQFVEPPAADDDGRSLLPVFQLACHLQAAWHQDIAQAHHITDRLQAMSEADADAPTFGDLEQLVVASAGQSVQHLAVCNQRLLLAERAANRAGNSLLNMQTAEDGTWYVDEMSVLVSMAGRMAELLHRPDQPADAAAIRCVHAVEALYAGLRQLLEQLSGPLLSDMIDGIFGESPNVLGVIGGASQLQLGVRPLRELLEESQAHLQATAAGATTAYDGVEVAVLRARLLAFGEQMETQRERNEGAALFLRWTALFDEVEGRLEAMYGAVDDLRVPTEWLGIDQVKEAADLSAMLIDSRTRPILQDIRTLWRLHTLIETFSQCLQQAYHFKGVSLDAGTGTPTVARPDYKPDELSLPMRQYCVAFVRQTMLGIATGAIAGLVCQRLQDASQQADNNSTAVNLTLVLNRGKATGLIALDALCGINCGATNGVGPSSTPPLLQYAQLDAVWRRAATRSQLQQTLQTVQVRCDRSQRLLCAHMWLHEHQLAGPQPGTFLSPLMAPPIVRSVWLQQMQQCDSDMTTLRVSVKTLSDDLLECVQDIKQQLCWMAGANPQLSGVSLAFNKAMLKCTQRTGLVHHSDNVQLDIRMHVLLKYELLRSQRVQTTEALVADQQFLELMATIEKSCALNASCAVSAVEEALVQLLDPEGPVDGGWLSSVADIVDEMTDQVRCRLEQLERRHRHTEECLYETAQRLRARMAVHHRMATETRQLLPATAPDGAKYLRSHQVFVDAVAELHGHALSRDFTSVVLQKMRDQMRLILSESYMVFERLYSVEMTAATTTTTKMAKITNSPAHDLSPMGAMSPMSGKPTKELQTEQKRNAYAVSVWRRVRMKLEGRDPDPNRPCTTAEQVDWMIREARNVDNLAVLYEGWAPWV